MYRKRLAAVLCCLLAVVVAVAGSGEGIPDRIENIDGPNLPPIWLSESALRQEMDAEDGPASSRLESAGERLFSFMPEGRLQWSLDSSEFEQAPDGILSCKSLLVSYHEGPKATDIAGLVKLSMAILLVRVVDSETGFLTGRAGELVEVEVLSVLKDTEPGTVDLGGPAPPAPLDGFYLWNWYARTVIDGRALCIGSRPLPHGEDLYLFLRSTRAASPTSSPIFTLDGIGTAIDADGHSYGALLDPSTGDTSDDIARQMANLEQIISRAKP